jgi:hypothetical protein
LDVTVRAVCLCLGWLILGPAVAQAQTATDRKVEQRIEAARGVYGPTTEFDRCRRRDDSEEIVVCVDRGEDQRVPSTAESDPTSREALFDGVPRAPQLDRGSCKGQAGCITGGWVPPPVYYIDLAALPQAPTGSDADLIAKGEKAED